MEWMTDPTALIGLATLIVLEIVLGIDNLIFVAILSEKLPPEQRQKARMIGLSLALILRLVFLASISWLTTLTSPLVTILNNEISGRDLIFLIGGGFLLFKTTMELHERMEGKSHSPKSTGKKLYAGFFGTIVQIIAIDLVFSIDSVITAVGMSDELAIMMTAVIVAMIVMMVAAAPLTRFVNAHPTVVVLCLGFLLMIGFSLIADGLGYHIPKAYLYAAIGFSVAVEAFNQVSQKRKYKPLTIDESQTLAQAIESLQEGSAIVVDASGAHKALVTIKAANH